MPTQTLQKFKTHLKSHPPLAPKPYVFEWLWAGLFGIILVRFALGGYFGGYFFFCVAGLVLVLLISRVRYFALRFGFYIILMNVVFVALGEISPLLNAQKLDYLLYDIERLLFGEYVGVWLTQNPVLSQNLGVFLCEFLSFFYLLFLFQLAYFFVYFLLYKPCAMFFKGLMSLYAIGFVGYIFLPAVGPYDFLATHFELPLSGGIIYEFLSANYTKGSNLTDVFPSLHCAVSGFIMIWTFHNDRAQFKLWIVPTIFLWISTFYLHYHYLIDCVAGAFLCAACGYLSIYFQRRNNENLRLF